MHTHGPQALRDSTWLIPAAGGGGGYRGAGVQNKLEQINVALTAFSDEMKKLGVWDQVALLTASDFARTLDSNGAGTDHACAPHSPPKNPLPPYPPTTPHPLAL